MVVSKRITTKIFTLIKILLLIFLGGCSLYIYFAFRTTVTDVSIAPQFADVYNKKFVVLEDGFLHWISRKDNIFLEGPPFLIFLPATVEEYFQDPVNWPRT